MLLQHGGDDIEEIESIGQILRILPLAPRGFPMQVFRGQSDWDWGLTPSMFRLSSSEIEGFNGWFGVEQTILSEFFSAAVPFLKDFRDTAFRRRMIAQHYGAPTRLLDWSFNPLVALYFATTSMEGDGAFFVARPNGDGRGSAGIDWVSEDDVEKHNFASMLPPAIDERIIAQYSCFTTHSSPKGNDAFVPVDLQGIKGPHDTQLIFKFRIREKSKAKVRLQLEQFGIDGARLFPGLDSLGAKAAWQFKRARHYQDVMKTWPD
jgi:FRG domain